MTLRRKFISISVSILLYKVAKNWSVGKFFYNINFTFMGRLWLNLINYDDWDRLLFRDSLHSLNSSLPLHHDFALLSQRKNSISLYHSTLNFLPVLRASLSTRRAHSNKSQNSTPHLSSGSSLPSDLESCFRKLKSFPAKIVAPTFTATKSLLVILLRVCVWVITGKWYRGTLSSPLVLLWSWPK
jgi:hypothetical protein